MFSDHDDGIWIWSWTMTGGVDSCTGEHWTELCGDTVKVTDEQWARHVDGEFAWIEKDDDYYDNETMCEVH